MMNELNVAAVRYRKNAQLFDATRLPTPTRFTTNCRVPRKSKLFLGGSMRLKHKTGIGRQGRPLQSLNLLVSFMGLGLGRITKNLWLWKSKLRHVRPKKMK